MGLLTVLVVCSCLFFVAAAEKDGAPPSSNGTGLETPSDIPNSENERQNNSTKGRFAEVVRRLMLMKKMEKFQYYSRMGAGQGGTIIMSVPFSDNQDDSSILSRILWIIFGTLAGVVSLTILIWWIMTRARTKAALKTRQNCRTDAHTNPKSKVRPPQRTVKCQA